MTEEEEKPRRRTCTEHCATCNRHFHGLNTFDAHIRTGECVEPDSILNTKGMPFAQVWTEDGWCDLEKGCWHDGRRVKYMHPVTIWQTYVRDPLQELPMQESGLLNDKAVAHTT